MWGAELDLASGASALGIHRDCTRSFQNRTFRKSNRTSALNAAKPKSGRVLGLRLWWWRGRDLNPRRSGYEFAKAHIGECRFVPENAVDLVLCLMNVSACPCG